jgi:hypothetical protein
MQEQKRGLQNHTVAAKEPLWGTSISGPIRRIEERRVVLNGNRHIVLEVLECGHQLVQTPISKTLRPKARRCAVCKDDRK